MFPQSSLPKPQIRRSARNSLQNDVLLTPSMMMFGAAPDQATKQADLQVL
jgi:hypothetical protein